MQYDLALDYELVAGGVMAGVVTKRGVGGRNRSLIMSRSCCGCLFFTLYE